jgi:hypothetical protein
VRPKKDGREALRFDRCAGETDDDGRGGGLASLVAEDLGIHDVSRTTSAPRSGDGPPTARRVERFDVARDPCRVGPGLEGP